MTRGTDEIRLDATRISCDAVAFEERIAASRLVDALELYEGDLLHGFFLGDAPAFEHWLDAERLRLQQAARGAAWSLAVRAETTGDIGTAAQWMRRVLEWAPYDEPTLRRLLELLDRAGDRAGALKEYAAFATRLRSDLEIEPSPETSVAIDAIRSRAEPNGSWALEQAAPSVTPPSRRVAGPDVHRGRGRFDQLPTLRLVAAAAVLLIGGAMFVGRRRDTLTPRRIVVLPLENLTGDSTLEPVGRIASDWIVQGLSRTHIVDVVPSVAVSERLSGLAPGSTEPASARARALARDLSAGTLVVGSYHRRGAELEFQADVIDVGNDRLVTAVEAIRGSRNDPMAAIDELRRRTLGAIAFRFDARIPQSLYAENRRPTYEAYEAFAAGEELRNRWQWRQALTYFRKAYALDTSFTVALLLAVIQHHNLREFAQADSLIRIVAKSRERLPPFERQLLQYEEADIRGDLPGVLEAAQGLTHFGEGFRAPMLEALNANRPREAVEEETDEVDSLARRRSGMWQLAHDRRLAEAYHRLGDYARELAEATRSSKHNVDVVEPVIIEMRALIGMGDVEQARVRVREALAMPPDANWPAGEILLRASDELRAHQHEDEAKQTLISALAWFAALPDSEARLPHRRRYRAAALLRADSLAAAGRQFRSLAKDFPNDPYYVASIGVALAQRGDTQRATAILRGALAKNPPYDFGHHVYEQARIAAALGNDDEAIRLLRDAFAHGFRFAFAGGVGGTAQPPDGEPHLDPVFDRLRQSRAFRKLERGKD